MKCRVKFVESKEPREPYIEEKGLKCRCFGCGHKLFNIIQKVDDKGVYHKIVCANCRRNMPVEAPYQ